MLYYMGGKSRNPSKKQISPELSRLLGDIARALRFLRKTAGYGSAKTFSEVQDINRSQYSRYEKGGVDMKIGSLISTVALFGLTEEDVFNPAFLNIGKSENSIDELAEKSLKIVRNRVANQVKLKNKYFDSDQVIDRTVMILTFCIEPRSRREILKHLHLANTSANFKRNAGLAVGQGWIGMTIPDKPNSSNQRYIITPRGRDVLGLKAK